MSQLELALAAEVSSRHISFVETGRSRPSREMILLLASVLDVPLRERNVLLEAGGFTAAYQESDLGAEVMKPVRKALDFILEHHEPYGCIVVNRRWDIVMMNQAVARQMMYFLGPERVASGRPINAMRMLFEPDGLRPYLVNWDEVAGAMLHRLHREALSGDPSSRARELLDEILARQDEALPWKAPDFERQLAPIVPMSLRKGDIELNLFSTIATLGTPQDITAQELRVESFFPADDETDRTLHRLAGSVS